MFQPSQPTYLEEAFSDIEVDFVPIFGFLNVRFVPKADVQISFSVLVGDAA